MSILLFVKKMPYSKNAVAFAGLLVDVTGSALTLLQVTDRKIKDQDVDQDFEEVKAMLPGVEFERKVREGDSGDHLLQEIKAGNYEMVVLRGRRAIRYRQRLGKKVARRIAHESPIPALIVKDTEHAPALNRILICTGGKDVAIPVIRKGAELAKASGADVTLLHVITPIPSMYTGMDEIEETLEELLQTDTPTARHLRATAAILAESDIHAHMEVRQGDVTEEILQLSSAGHYDLILVGAPPVDSRIKEWFMGDVTRNLVNHAGCAVLVVR